MKLSLKTLTLLAVGAMLALAGTASASHQAGAATTKTVKVRDNSYSRSSITIAKNDKIKFAWQNTNHDHNVTKKSGPASVHSQTQDGNYTYTKKFTTTGKYSLHCTIHPSQMKLSVTVTK
jgi:plastocyanin